MLKYIIQFIHQYCLIKEKIMWIYIFCIIKDEIVFFYFDHFIIHIFFELADFCSIRIIIQFMHKSCLK